MYTKLSFYNKVDSIFTLTVICIFLQLKSFHEYFSVTYVLNRFHFIWASDRLTIRPTKKKTWLLGTIHFQPPSKFNFSKINQVKIEID